MDLSFEEAFPVSIMLIVVLVTTALTAVMYRQRFEVVEARRAAAEAFDALEEAQGRLLISENATSQNRLAAALAHELNTPLGALSSAFGTLSSAFSKQSTVDSRLQEVVAGAADPGGRSLKRLSETVERMKRVTNLGRAELRRVDLNQLWRDTVILLDDELAPRVRFEMQLEPVPLIDARPQQLAAVFSNLVRNAAAGITASGRDGMIRVSTSSSDKEIVKEVTDDGEGIADEALPRLFEPTFRAERGRVGTANWGLFTSRGIVTAHGGHIEIEIDLGRGTAARIRLPAQRE